MALSSGGGAGAGLSMAATAYQAPPTMPSGPSHTASSSTPMMRSSNVTTLPSQVKRSPEELARSVAPILAIAPGAQRGISWSGAGAKYGEGIAGLRFSELGLRISLSEKSYRTLRKFVKRSENVTSVFTHCVAAVPTSATSKASPPPAGGDSAGGESFALPADIFSHISSRAAGSVLPIPFPHLPAPFPLPFAHLFAIHLHAVYLSLPPAVSGVTPYITVPLPGCTPEHARSHVRAGLAALDMFAPPGAPVAKKKKAQQDASGFLMPPQAACTAVAALARGGKDVSAAFGKEINRTIQVGSESGARERAKRAGGGGGRGQHQEGGRG